MKLRRSLYSHPKPFSEESSAPRRGLAGRTIEQLAGRAGGSLALAGGPPPSRHGCQAPQALSTGTRWGGPARARRGVVAQEVRMPAVPSSACRCPRPASGVLCLVRVSQHHACLSKRPLSGVRCGLLSVQVSGVRRGCPVSVGSRVHCVRPGGCGRGGGADSRMAGMAGVGVVAGPVHGQFVGCSGRNLAVEAGVGRAGPAEASAWTSPSWWELVEVVAGSTAWGTGMGWMGAGIARWWRAGVRSEAATTLRGHRVRLRAGSRGRCEPPGLGCDLRVRPWGGRRMQ
jgi:hypothetical protein